MPYRVLVADDEQDIRNVLRLYLEDAGYDVCEAANGIDALQALGGGDIDLCLLDIMMPGIDGYQVIKQVRKASDVPIIVISAKGEDPQKILGLNLGADDYMVKPFNPLEAVARVNTNIRRAKGEQGTQGVRQSTLPQLVFRDLVLDQDSCTLTRAGERIELTPVEYKMMVTLMEHPGRVFTKQVLYERAWGQDYVAADNSVMVSISKLRSKLCDDPQAYIRTIRGLGYRLGR